MLVERIPSAPSDAIVITVSTTPYSAIVCPSSRASEPQNFRMGVDLLVGSAPGCAEGWAIPVIGGTGLARDPSPK